MSKIRPWERLGSEEVFRAYSRGVDKVTYKLPDGETADFYIKAEPAAVCILGLTSNLEIILIDQYRPGPGKVLRELPGGYVKANENPVSAAKRELREETGFAGKLEFIGVCLDDAYSTLERHCFVATDCEAVGQPQSSPTEQTSVALVSVKEFRKLLRTGQMTDVEVGYLGLDHLNLL